MKDNLLNEHLLKITEYKAIGELPNPFMFDNGNYVSSIDEWERRKREIAKTAIDVQFGTLPPAPEIFRVEQLNCGKEHRSYKIHAGTKEKQISFVVKLIMPKGNNRPIIIDGDMCAGYFMKEDFINAAVSKDIGWLLFDRTELAHDLKEERGRTGALYDIYPEYTFGALGAWAWGYSRCVDALIKLNLPQIDCSCIVATGHSRGGKATMLAGAVDERIAIVNPNEACLVGGGCYRIEMVGDYPDLLPWRSETLKDICKETDFWIGPTMKNYIERENELPFDTHFLKALVAPRILFVSEAAGDIWANPIGSWMTTEAAKEVYEFLGAGPNIYWYFRTGTHYHKAEDIEMLVNIICHIHDNEDISDSFYKLPFSPPEYLFSWRKPNFKLKGE